MAFPKTHSLIELLELCLPLDRSFEFQRDLMVRLDRYAVIHRYPGEVAEKDEARNAVQAVQTVRGVPETETWAFRR